MDIKVKLPHTAMLVLLVFLLSVPSVMADTQEVSSETGVYYTVKKGDTLWGLSEKFSDDPFTWPDLWSKNGQLKNPHRIYPGQKLKLIRKSDIDTFGMAAQPMEMSQETKAPAETTAKAPAPKERVYHYARMNHAGFMTRESVPSHGKVFKLNGQNRIMIGTGDQVFIKASNASPLVIGAQYTTYRILSPKYIQERLIDLSKKQYKNLKKSLGPQYYLTGVIEILKEKDGYFIGQVVNAYRDIRVDDCLTPFRERSQDIPVRKGLASVSGEIIVSEDGETTFGQSMTGFINRGMRDGVQKGQIYSVFYNETKESENIFDDKDLSVPVIIGKFIVLDTRESTSTILAINSDQEFKPGHGFKAE